MLSCWMGLNDDSVEACVYPILKCILCFLVLKFLWVCCLFDFLVGILKVILLSMLKKIFGNLREEYLHLNTKSEGMQMICKGLDQIFVCYTWCQ